MSENTCPFCEPVSGKMIPKQKVTVGALSLDWDSQTATVFGRNCDLSVQESKLLGILIKYKRNILSREAIQSLLWNTQNVVDSRIVDVYVGYLRKKIGSEVIKSVRGIGYTLNTRLLEGQEGGAIYG